MDSSGTDHDSEATRRLRSADPALGTHPDLGQIRAEVTERISAGGVAETATWEGPTMGRGRSGAVIAVAAAATLAVGVGGYALGHTQGTDGRASIASADESETSEGAALVGEAGTTSDSYAEGLSGLPSGPVRLIAGEGLSTEGGVAQVSTSQAKEVDGEAAVRELAAEFGVTGEVEEDGDWSSIQADGTSISGYSDPTSFTLSYDNSYLMTDCESNIGYMEEDMALATGGVDDLPELDPARCPAQPTTDISQQAATDLAEETTAKFGIDPATIDFTVDTMSVEAYADGTGIDADGAEVEVHMGLRAEGVIYAGVSFSESLSLGDYPIISPAAAVERHNDPIYGRLDVMPATVDEAEWYGGMYPDEWSQPEPLDPGDLIPVPGQISTATSTELTTGTLWDMNGGRFTVPIYLVTTDDDTTLPVLALAEEAIELLE